MRASSSVPDAFQIAVPNGDDFAAILELQSQNHLSVLPPEARGDGFVTTQFDQKSLENLRRHNSIAVARAANGDLAGYVGAHAWDFSGASPWQMAVKTLFPLFVDGEEIRATNSFQYGPICVASPFRGSGVMKGLFGAIKTGFGAHYAFGVTFIDHRNARSLAAHERKLGFSIVAELPFEDARYHVLAFPIS